MHIKHFGKLKKIPAPSNFRWFSSLTESTRRRVVCTGIGVVTPLGCGVNHVWNNLINGHTGVRKIDGPDFEKLPSKVAAFIPIGQNEGEFDASKIMLPGDKKILSTHMIYALSAADEAIRNSGLDLSSEIERYRIGVAVGGGMFDLSELAETSKNLKERGYRRVSPYFTPKLLVNTAAGHISIRYGLHGPNHSVSTACSTGTHAIGDAMRFIRNNDADVMICGGTDAAIIPVVVAGFCRANALSTKFNDSPETASRPFDKNRDGFVMGEGSTVLVLEEYERALKRGAPILAEILGYGLSGDAHHITAPREDGYGAYLCMKGCLRDADVLPTEVSYVNAHATSTPLGDVIENRAIKRVFEQHAYKLAINGLKGAFGHLLGAAGAIETAMTVMALKEKIIPPTINIQELDDGFDLDYVPNEKREFAISNQKRRIALKNSFGFGGTNASLCIGEI